MSIFLIFFLFLSEVYSFERGNIFSFACGEVNIPVFGEFGDRESGFKKSFGLRVGVFKNYDDIISYGFISSQSSYYKNRQIDIKFKFFSFTPALFFWIDNQRRYYLYGGVGIYHWSQPKTSSYLSTSSDEAGFRIGVGYKKNFYKKIGLGGGLEFEHLFNINGKNFNLGPSNIISFSINLYLSL
jgi:hypothetical protein